MEELPKGDGYRLLENLLKLATIDLTAGVPVPGATLTPRELREYHGEVEFWQRARAQALPKGRLAVGAACE